jgi:hypothetical protein
VSSRRQPSARTFIRVLAEIHTGHMGPTKMSYVVSEGRLLSLRATDWLVLLVGGVLAGVPLLLF